jgi:hypothetical protein
MNISDKSVVRNELTVIRNDKNINISLIRENTKVLSAALRV